MPGKTLPIFFLLLIAYAKCCSQGCTTLGQTPGTAFPVCGVQTFKQQTVPQCYNYNVPASTCRYYPDTNPFWYRFTCYASGTLGFTITPNDLSDDYDWELFDITGHSPGEVYADDSLFVVANWSGSYGVTGTSSTNTNIISCGSDPAANVTTFSKMPNIIKGHTYLLLVSHFTQSQSGYSLSFGGGSASIVDPLKPEIISASANCSGQVIYLKLNKQIQCASIDVDGGDFKVSGLSIPVTATGINCSTSFAVDSIEIALDKPLPAGNYTLTIKKGADNNTLLDNCSNAVAENSTVSFTVYPLAPTPMDSIMPMQCSPDTISLYFRKPISCSSVAGNGSDFSVSGNASISVAGAAGSACVNGLSNIIKVKLNKPIKTAGNFAIVLKEGTDGNTLLDECVQETPAGSSLNFITADTVSAVFNYKLALGCVFDTLYYAHNGSNGVNIWNWSFDTDGISHTEDSLFLFKGYGQKHIALGVTNGVCSDSAAVDITLDNELVARFSILPSAELCPEDALQLTDSSTGKIVSWYWTYGDGTISTLQKPFPKKYAAPPSAAGRTYPVSLIVKNNIGCFDTSAALLKVLYSCYIAVPSAFTPNGDGLNDYLYPINAYKADNLHFRVYNRWGQLVFETTDRAQKWNGAINGNPQGAGTYVWMLTFTNRDTGEQFSQKGTTVLIR